MRWLADRVYAWLADYGLELATLVAFTVPQLQRGIELALFVLFCATIPYLTAALANTGWIFETRGNLRRHLSYGIAHETIEILVAEGARPKLVPADWRHFFIILDRDGDINQWRARVRDAAERAIRRICNREHTADTDPTRVLLALAIFICSVVTYWFGVSPPLALAALTAVVRLVPAIGRVLGLQARRRFTVASQFRLVRVVDVYACTRGDERQFRVVLEIEPRALARVPSAT